MSQTASFFVPGIPKPQPRPRVGRNGHTYNPPTADAWKAAVRQAWRLAGVPAFTKHVRMRLSFALPRPVSHFTKRGALVKGAPEYPTGRPDIDNLSKAVMDALGDVRAFANDAAVISLAATKDYGPTPGCIIILTEGSDE